jgi:DNA-binding transcriptional regulator YiaG
MGNFGKFPEILRCFTVRLLRPPDILSYNTHMTSTQFRQLLARAGLNQKQAAEILEVTDRTMRRWTSGATPVPKMAVWTILRYTEMRDERK